ncbi:hypothetical protein [Leucobacter chromiireducens]|uniref:hypothetical protein n=1 Tax=Leucobacter chromiireducens TaxID=283877 RepID=UPI000F63C958|nr:hypothetical protein [Leucobacter chromiireducens]
MSSQRRVAPALAMTTAIAGAMTLAALFPLNASGSWSAQPDEWETARATLLTPRAGNPHAEAVLPDSITLLERTPDGDFFYAADTRDGALQTGIIDVNGDGVTCSGPVDAQELACGTHAWDSAWYYALWVQRTPGDTGGYRHKLRYFATEAEYDAYWELNSTEYPRA